MTTEAIILVWIGAAAVTKVIMKVVLWLDTGKWSR